jgi:NAD(P)H dehydrogenase (quinone)
VGTFFSTASIGSGQESTALSMIPFFAHMGLIYVPMGGKSAYLGNIRFILY